MSSSPHSLPLSSPFRPQTRSLTETCFIGGGMPQLAAALASVRVDVEVALTQFVLCTILTLWMVHFVEKRDAGVRTRRGGLAM